MFKACTHSPYEADASSKRPQLQRVLFVDDDPDMRSIVEYALEILGGFQTCICASGKEALAIAAQFRPQLILLDYNMPDMGGPEALLELRRLRETTRTPVVYITAWRPVLDPELDLGVVDFLVKPLDILELPHTLRDIWQHAQT